MKNVKEIVQKIESQYVGEDCIEYIVPYGNSITMLNEDGILFHSDTDSDLYINKYLEDERRKNFPYSNIPIHYLNVSKNFKRSNSNSIISYTNQLFEFEKPYIRIGDGIIESFVIKDNNEALIINKVLNFSKRTEYMKREEIERLFEKNTEDEKAYLIYLSGKMFNKDISSEEKVSKVIMQSLKENIDYIERYQFKYGETMVGQYVYPNSDFLNIAGPSTGQSKVNKTTKHSSNTMIIARVKDSNISLQHIIINHIGLDNYKITIYDGLINKYSKEDLIQFPINSSKEPKIPLRLNKNVTRQDLQDAKQMVKSLRK